MFKGGAGRDGRKHPHTHLFLHSYFLLLLPHGQTLQVAKGKLVCVMC